MRALVVTAPRQASVLDIALEDINAVGVLSASPGPAGVR